MNIEELILKYYHHVNDKLLTHTDLHHIPECSGYINLIIHGLTHDIEYYEEVLRVFKDLPYATNLCFDEDGRDLCEYFQKNFTFDKDDDIKGYGILHVKGVGYIFTSIKEDIKRFFEYSLEEYETKSNEYVVVGIAKQEAHYIKDWVSYHIHIGFDKIYLFDNNSIDGESYDELLKEYVDANKLEIINIRGEKEAQIKNYKSLYLSMPFKYMAFIDIDEYIWFNEKGKYSNIKQFLDDLNFGHNFGVMLQWHCYAASGDDESSELPIWEANTKLLPFNAKKDCRCEYIHSWVKSIFKKGYPLSMNEHFGWYEDGVYNNIDEIGCDGERMIKEKCLEISYEDFLNQDVYVKHFILRNIKDFFYGKYLRGHAGLKELEGLDGWAYCQWRQNMNYFTDVTPVLTDKEQLFLQKHGMKINYMFHPDVVINYYTYGNTPYIDNVIQYLIVHEILPNVNGFFNKIKVSLDKNNLVQQDTPEKLRYGQFDTDFLERPLINYMYLDNLFGDETRVIRKNIQDPIIMNISIPFEFTQRLISIEEQKRYAFNIQRVFEFSNLRGLLRRVLEEGITVIPHICCDGSNEDVFGWKESLEGFFKEKQLNLSLPPNYMRCNTMITPYQQWLKIKEYQQLFESYYGTIPNDNIVSNLQKGYTSEYHAYIASVISVIEKPYYVWPN